MTLFAKLMISAGILAALSGGAYALRTSIYDEGVRDGMDSARKAIEAVAAESARKNATIVKGDQALIIAKTEDREKIKIIYRNIREQIAPQIIELPVYTDRACVVPASGLRLIAAAASGGNLPANPDQPAGHPSSGPADAKK